MARRHLVHHLAVDFTDDLDAVGLLVPREAVAEAIALR